MFIMRAPKEGDVIKTVNNISVKVLKKLGGGGHFDMAGAQIKDSTLAYACELLKGAIDDYLDHDIAERK